MNPGTDVRSFLLTNLIFPSEALRLLLVDSGFRIGPDRTNFLLT